MVNGGQMSPGACSALGARPLWSGLSGRASASPNLPYLGSTDYTTRLLATYLHYHAYISRAVLGERGWDCVLSPPERPTGFLPRPVSSCFSSFSSSSRAQTPLPSNEGSRFQRIQTTIRGFVLRSHKLARPRRSASRPHTCMSRPWAG